MSKTFTTFSKADCLASYPKIVEIGNNHWEDAIVMFERKRYGLSISLHIVSIEEYIKACILALDGRGFRFRKVKGMEAVLSKNHRLRYAIAYGLYLLTRGGMFMKNTMLKLHHDVHFEQRLRNSIQNDNNYKDRFFKVFWLRQFAKVQKELMYFASMDRQRQDGMYSGYENSLKTPDLITAEDYKILYVKIHLIKEMIEEFLKYLFLDDNEIRNRIDELRRLFHKQKFYVILEEMLTGVMGPQKNVFSEVHKFVASSSELIASRS